MNQKHSPALIAIVLYKIFTASLLAFTSIALFFALKNHDSLANFSENYFVETKHPIIEASLDKFLNLNPKTLKLTDVGAGIYAIVNAIEAVGLWYQNKWVMIFVLVVVGITIPVEIFELIKGITPIKLVIFLVNVAVFWYLLQHFTKSKD